MSKVNIPLEVFDPFFFSEKQIILNPEEISSFNAQEPFVHEIAFFAGIDSVMPWENAAEFVPGLFQAWNQMQAEIKTLFDNRNNKDTLFLMKRGIAYVIEFIFWTNELPACNIRQFDYESLQIKPVNFSERLQFLMKRPNIYPSFAQLNELIEEQNKHFSKKLAIDKAEKNNNK